MRLVDYEEDQSRRVFKADRLFPLLTWQQLMEAGGLRYLEQLRKYEQLCQIDIGSWTFTKGSQSRRRHRSSR